ncbi:MAG: zinc-ribbon domain-containing protein [Actinomycetota bacterium]
MNFCERCGYEYEPGARFCAACGAKVPSEPEAQAEEAPPEDLQVPVWPTMDVSEVGAGGLEAEQEDAPDSGVPVTPSDAETQQASTAPEIEPASMAAGSDAPVVLPDAGEPKEAPSWVFADEDAELNPAIDAAQADVEEDVAETVADGYTMPADEQADAERVWAEKEDTDQSPREPAGNRSRMWTAIGIGSFVLALIILIVLLVTGGDDQEPTTTVTSPSPAPTQSPSHSPTPARPSPAPVNVANRAAVILTPIQASQRAVSTNLQKADDGPAALTALRTSARAVEEAIKRAQVSTRNLPPGVRTRTLLFAALLAHGRYATELATLPTVGKITDELVQRIESLATVTKNRYRLLSKLVPKAAQIPVDPAAAANLDHLIPQPETARSPAPGVPGGGTSGTDPTVRISN